jgi:hypothetical protein
MLRAADTAGPHIDLAGIGLGVRNQVGNRLRRQRRVYHQHAHSTDDAGNRRDIADEIETKIVVKRGVPGVIRTNHQERIAIGRRPHHRLGGETAARARPVLDHELLAEPFRQQLARQPANYVSRAAGRPADDQPHWPRRIGLRKSEE